jgi:TPP-dependent pyruvate/acetoin dehydrogenase alpha subunit
VATEVSTKAAGTRPLPDDRLKQMLYLLKLARYFDERMEAL